MWLGNKDLWSANMEWLNVFGLVSMIVIMIPNIIFAAKCKNGFVSKWSNKYVECFEQIGRIAVSGL